MHEAADEIARLTTELAQQGTFDKQVVSVPGGVTESHSKHD